MKSNVFYLVSLLLVFTASCKKNGGNKAKDSLTLHYTGSSEALGEGREVHKVVKSGIHTSFVSGKTYSLAGTQIVENPTLSESIDVYNEQTGTWQKLAIQPFRKGFGVGALGKQLVVAGGNLGALLYDVVNLYDLSTGIATTHKLSEARSNVAIAGAGDKLLFAGGNTLTGNGYSKTVDIFDQKTGQWTVSALSKERSYISAISVGNKVLFAGGSSGNQSDVVDIYDVPSGKWSANTLSNGQIINVSFSGGGKAFFTGGVTDASPNGTSTVDIYDAASNTWSLLTLAGNTMRIRGCATDSHAFFTYGSNQMGLAEKLAIYDIKTSKLVIKDLPYSVSGFAISAVEHQVLLFGGSKINALIDAEPTEHIIRYDVASGNFDTSFSLPVKVNRAVAVNAGKKLLVTGGITYQKSPLALLIRKTVSVFELK